MIFFTSTTHITYRPAPSYRAPSVSITSAYINDNPFIAWRQRFLAIRSRFGIGLDRRPRSHRMSRNREVIFSLATDGKPRSLWEDRCRSHIPSHLSTRFSLVVCWRSMGWGSTYSAGLSADRGSLVARSFIHQQSTSMLGEPLLLACHASFHIAKGPTWTHVTSL